MSLVKTSLLNGIAVAVRLASALMLNKILAVYIGPAGYAIIGQFQNVVSIVVNLAGGVLGTGVTKTTAQHFDDETRQHAVWRTAFRFSLGASLLAGFSLLFIGHWLSEWLLHRTDMSNVFVWLALTLPALAANNLLLSISNGKKEVGIYVLANIFGSIISLAVTGLLAYNFGLWGALVAFTINPTITLFATASILIRQPWFKAGKLWGKMDSATVRELAGFGLMALTSALMVPLTQMFIRDHLTAKLGLPAAGYWQAMWKISEIYLMLITSTLSVYYLPRIAEIRTASELKAEIKKAYRFLLPLTISGAVVIFLLRDLIISILFTQEFAPMRELFPWQLAGDVIKMSSWMLGYILIGRAMVKLFVIKEIAMSILFALMTIFFVGEFGLQGVTIAYVLMYIVNWILLVFIVRHEMRKIGSDITNLPAGLINDAQ